MNHIRFWTLLVAILTTAAARLLPHPPNFTPVGAMALFGGACFANRLVAHIAPLAALLLSDLVLGLLVYGSSVFSLMPFVYLGFFLNTCLGVWIGRQRSPTRIGIAAILAALVSFGVSNFGVWILGHGGPYPSTMEGLLVCYAAALPFLQNTILGNLLFSVILFGGFALAERRFPVLCRTTLEGPQVRP